MSVYLSVTTLVGATCSLKAKVRYQQKALDAGNKMNAIACSVDSARGGDILSGVEQDYGQLGDYLFNTH